MKGMAVEELYGKGKAGSGTGKGKEVDTVPLCRRCADEIDGEKGCLGGEDHLVSLALARVDRFDGGLSRRRWEAVQRDADADAVAPSYSRLQHDPDGPEDPDETCRRRPLSPIYVDLRDPIGGPAFKRSPTKPIPRWMQYLPSARREQDEQRPASLLDEHFPSRGADTADSDEVNAPPPVPPHTTLSSTTVPSYMPTQISRPFTLTMKDPAQQPSSARIPGPVKHVRFDGSLPGGEKTSSESSEHSERYSVGRLVDVRSENAAIPSCLDGRMADVASPVTRQAGVCSPPLAGDVPDHGPDHGPDYGSASGPRIESGSSARQVCYHARRGGCEEYLTSPGSSADGEEGEARTSKPLGMTFQDQLKRVFGFT